MSRETKWYVELHGTQRGQSPDDLDDVVLRVIDELALAGFPLVAGNHTIDREGGSITAHRTA